MPLYILIQFLEYNFVKALKKYTLGKARAEAERDQLAASLATTTNASLIGIIESGVYDENGQLVTIITGDAEYRSNIARQRWHWAFTKIVQVSQSDCFNQDPCDDK